MQARHASGVSKAGVQMRLRAHPQDMLEIVYFFKADVSIKNMILLAPQTYPACELILQVHEAYVNSCSVYVG